MFNRLQNSQIQEMVGMRSRRLFTGLALARDLSAMAMLTLPMSRSLSTALRCVWRKHVRSIALCAKPTELASARLKKSGPSPNHRILPETKKLPPQPANGNGHGSPKVRDRLCQINRQHQLDPNLVKAYATEFCGVTALRDATREQVEDFVAHLADWAEKDRNALLCQLNSYPGKKEGAA